MKTSVIVLILLLIGFVFADWETIQKNYELNPRTTKRPYIGVDFSTSATAIKYEVQCSTLCEFILLNYQNFLLFQQGKPYSYYQQEIGTEKKGEWNEVSDIKKRLLIVVVNEAYEVNYVSIRIDQDVPKASIWAWLWVVILIPIVIVVIFTCVIVSIFRRGSRGGYYSGGGYYTSYHHHHHHGYGGYHRHYGGGGYHSRSGFSSGTRGGNIFTGSV